MYSRPFLTAGKVSITLGGYLEVNSIFSCMYCVSECLSFQLPRLTIFMTPTINKRLNFLIEIEFEEGARDINIHVAALNLMLNSSFNLLGGIIRSPIIAFNQNHDGPKWVVHTKTYSCNRSYLSNLFRCRGGIIR